MKVYFQPGNAYNEETIANAKVLGKTIYAGLEEGERRAKINEQVRERDKGIHIIVLSFQIDRIRDAISETKTIRLSVMKGESTPSTPSSLPSLSSSHLSSLSFEALEQRMQALAVLMLHYCAALQVREGGG